MRLTGTGKSVPKALQSEVDRGNCPEDVKRSIIRAKAINSVMALCGECCGAISLEPDGQKLRCARVVRKDVPEELREAILNCQVPAVFEKVTKGELDPVDVTSEMLRDLLPKATGRRE